MAAAQRASNLPVIGMPSQAVPAYSQSVIPAHVLCAAADATVTANAAKHWKAVSPAV